MRKLITFLGPNPYEETTYRWGEQEYTTRFFAEAVSAWLKPDRVYVLLTHEAKQSENWGDLQKCLSDPSQVKSVDIPSGQSQEELWQIFREIDKKIVSHNDELVFDITHGFRLLPLLSLLVIAYLRQVKQVKLLHVLYGARDAHTEVNGKEISPVYEITPLVSLLDWLTAAEIFVSTRNGSQLARLINPISSQQIPAEKHSAESQHLAKLAESIQQVSDNVMLSRVLSLAHSVNEMYRELNIPQTREAIAQKLPPLVPLLDEVRNKYKRFNQRTLEAQADLIEWYVEHGHVLQALTLAREWVVNYYLQSKGRKRGWNNKEARDDAEEELGNKTSDKRLRKLLERIKEYRNDAAHCGFRSNPKSSSELIEGTRQVMEEIRAILRDSQNQR